MCKILQSAWTPGTPRSPKSQSDVSLNTKVSKKLFKVTLTQNLRLKSGLISPVLDLLTFLKACDFKSLLGERLFCVLDQDKDGLISSAEFELGVRTVFSGTVTETAAMIFQVLDFNDKGYITSGDVVRAFEGCAHECKSCGRKFYSRIKESIEEMFKIKTEIDFESLKKCVQSATSLITYLREALIKGLPPTFDELFDTQRIDCCRNTIEPAENLIFPMVLDGKMRYFEGKSETLYAYNSISKSKLVSVILLRDAFVDPIDDCSFSLGNLHFSYIFQANSSAECNKWISFIYSLTHIPHSVHDSYKIFCEIGTGSSCKVFHAVNRLTSQPAAVKTIRKANLSVKAELAARREIRILSLLDHPNVIALYEVIETKEEINIVTELLSEGSVFDYLEKRSFCIPEAIAKKLAVDICAGVNYLHSKGIIHRDLKLENLLLTSNGEEMTAKVIDFGLAAQIGPEETLCDAVGTLKYAAPEVISRIHYREKVDSWSLGVVLYVLLRGCMPFAGKTEEEIVLSVLKRRLHFAGDRWANISPSAISLLSGLLTRDPRRRMSMQEAANSEWMSDGRRDNSE